MLLVLLGCASEAIVLQPTITLHPDVSTAVTVAWETPSAGDGVVAYGIDDGYGDEVVALNSADGLTHEAVINGLPGGEDFHLQVESVTDDGTLVSEDVPFTTTLPPQEMPAIWPEDAGEGAIDGGYLITSLVFSPSAAVIFDANGNMLWWRSAGPNDQVTDSRLSRDGQSVLSMTNASDMASDRATLTSTPFSGGEGWSLRLAGGHHDFLELPDGRFAYIAIDQRDYNGKSVAGDQLVEIDRDGTSRVVWSTWDGLNPDTIDPANVFYGGKIDWTHSNSLTYDPATRQYWVSCHNISTIVVIDAATGATLEQIGGAHSTVEFTGDGPVEQHAPSLVPGGFLIFNNGAGASDHLWSEAVEYSYDPTNHKVVRVWSYSDPETLYSPFLGSAERLENGDTLISWGAGGRLSEVTSDGQVVMQIDGGLGTAFGYTHPVAEFGG